MTEPDFYTLVANMRQAQIDYFRTRDKDCLRDSKRLEKQVDEAIAERKKMQSKLF